MSAVPSESNERIHAARGAELGALLGRLSLHGDEKIPFVGKFMYAHILEGTIPAEGAEDLRQRLVPHSVYQGKMKIIRMSPNDTRVYQVCSDSYSTTFTSAPDAQWQFNLRDPNQADFRQVGHFFLSLQLSQNTSGLCEARFYSQIGKKSEPQIKKTVQSTVAP